MRSSRPTPSRRARPGRGKASGRPRSQVRAEELGIEVRTPASLRTDERAGAFRRARRRCRGGRGLWADPAAADPRRAEGRVPQCPRLAAAALARRGAGPARDHGRRRGDRRHHHADGGRARHRPDAAQARARDRRQERRATYGRTCAKLGADADGRDARRRRRSRPTPQPDEGVTYAAKISKDEARIDWSGRAAEVERQVRAFDPSPAPGSRPMASGSSCWRRKSVDGSGRSRARCSTIGLTIACGDGASGPIAGPARRHGRDDARTSCCAASPSPAGTVLR